MSKVNSFDLTSILDDSIRDMKASQFASIVSSIHHCPDPSLEDKISGEDMKKIMKCHPTYRKIVKFCDESMEASLPLVPPEFRVEVGMYPDMDKVLEQEYEKMISTKSETEKKARRIREEAHLPDIERALSALTLHNEHIKSKTYSCVNDIHFIIPKRLWFELEDEQFPRNIISSIFHSYLEGTHKRYRVVSSNDSIVLESWFDDHLSHPYPRPEDIEIMLHQTRLVRSQITCWFVNARRRRHWHKNGICEDRDCPHFLSDE